MVLYFPLSSTAVTQGEALVTVVRCLSMRRKLLWLVPEARLVHVATLLQLVVLCVAPDQCHAELVALHHEDETQPSEVPRSCHEIASGLLGQRLIAKGRGVSVQAEAVATRSVSIRLVP